MTQLDRVEARLKSYGRITRNQCLRNRISRLSAIIALLEEKGYVFNAFYEKTERGQDYIYETVSVPEPNKYQKFDLVMKNK